MQDNDLLFDSIITSIDSLLESITKSSQLSKKDVTEQVKVIVQEEVKEFMQEGEYKYSQKEIFIPKTYNTEKLSVLEITELIQKDKIYRYFQNEISNIREKLFKMSNSIDSDTIENALTSIWILPTSTFECTTILQILDDGLEEGLTKDDIFLNKLMVSSRIEKTLESWIEKKNSNVKKRIPILEEAITAHLEGKYYLSVSTLMPQIEGILKDAVEEAFNDATEKDDIRVKLNSLKENCIKDVADKLAIKWKKQNPILGIFADLLNKNFPNVISYLRLKSFINNDEAILPDGTKGAGLLAYLRNLKSKTGRDRADVIAKVFKDVTNRMISGTLLWDVLNKVNDIHFDKSEEVNLLSTLYESMLKKMRDAAGDSGEFYTPRPVVRFIVQVMEPKLGETIFDPACGTGGFLVEAYEYLKKNCSAQDWQILQKSIIGGEAKSLPLMLAHMSLLLHGFEYPDIDDGNSLRFTLSEIGEKDWVDVILTNPPFGGEEEDRIKNNFPPDRQTKETALLFLQLIMRRLRQRPKPGRTAVVFPNGVLFGDNTCAKLKEDLLKDFNLHTIVRLPNGVFAPYTGIPTNLLFFDRSGQTDEIWYYELPLPEGRKTYTKTKPIQDEDFAECVAWWKNREENGQAYKYNFREAYKQAIKEATPHWDAAKKAEETANQLVKTVKELAEKIQSLHNSILDFSPSKDIARIKNQILVVKDEVKHAQTEERTKNLMHLQRFPLLCNTVFLIASLLT
ncbi:HsdM family class I SAM-dependent methyltransferase [Nostoc commune]|nr:N-6 DNA methylase [Nostoc commune]